MEPKKSRARLALMALLGRGNPEPEPRALTTRNDALVAQRVDAALARAFGTGGGWHNQMTGFGMMQNDAGKHTKHAPPRELEVEESFAIYRQGGLNARVVDLPIGDAMRGGWSLEGVEPDDVDDLELLAKALPAGADESHRGVAFAAAQLMTWSDVCGGGALQLFVDDDLAPTEPVADGAQLLSTRTVCRRDLRPASINADTNSPDYGQITTWRVTRPGAEPLELHRSRLILDGWSNLPGALTHANADGWGDSVYLGIYEDLGAIESNRAATGRLIDNFEVFARRMNGLAESLAQGGDEVLNRVGQDALMSSLFRQYLLDGDNESIERISANVSGLPELIASNRELLAAKLGFPVTKLFGQSPGGLSTDNESGTRDYYDMVAARWREARLRRILTRLYGLLGAPMGFEPTIKFPSLYEPTDAEKAQTVKTKVETLVAASGGASIILASEAAAAAGALGVVVVDQAARDAQAAAAGSADLDPLAAIQQARLAVDLLHSTSPSLRKWASESLGSPAPSDAEVKAYWAAKGSQSAPSTPAE